MADQTPTTEPQAAEPQTAEPQTAEPQTAPVTEDWKSKYDALQSEYTKTSQSLSEKQKLLDLIDWQSAPQQQPQYQPPADDPIVTQRSMLDTLGQRERVIDAKIALVEFRQKNPDLVKYENTLMVGVIENLRRKTGGAMPMDKLIDKAAEELRNTLAEERKAGETSAQEKLKAAAAASGLGSAGTHVPKSDDIGTPDDYIKQRLELQRKRSG